MAISIVVNFNRLPELAQRFPQATADIVGKTAFDIEARAKVAVPVDTGNLKNSIQTDHQGTTATVTAHAEYALYVEMGTARMGAQPYMTPAAEAARPGFIAAMTALGKNL